MMTSIPVKKDVSIWSDKIRPLFHGAWDNILSDDLIHLPPTQADFNARVMHIQDSFCFKD